MANAILSASNLEVHEFFVEFEIDTVAGARKQSMYFQNTSNCQMFYGHNIDHFLGSNTNEKCKALFVEIMKKAYNSYYRPLCLFDVSTKTFNNFVRMFGNAIHNTSEFISTNNNKRIILIVRLSKLPNW